MSDGQHPKFSTRISGFSGSVRTAIPG
jgi:hypothetical protein